MKRLTMSRILDIAERLEVICSHYLTFRAFGIGRKENKNLAIRNLAIFSALDLIKHLNLGFNPLYRVLPVAEDEQCGIQTAPLGPITNIVGGVISDEGEWPWQGVLLIRDASGDDDFRCGATLLTPYWVVTAAHCL